MAEVTFGAPENASPAPVIEVQTVATPVEGVTIECPNTSVAPLPTNTALAAPSGLVLGDKLPDFRDIILPRLNLVHNIGSLKDTFIPGSVAFDRKLVVFVPPDVDKATGTVKRASTPPAIITVLGFRPTRFVEKVEGGGRSIIVPDEEQVRAHGGTTDYQEWQLKKASGMAYYQPLADAVVAVQRPDAVADDGTVFVYEVDGHKIALGLWSMKGSSYTAAAKRVFFTARAVGCLRAGGYPSWSYALTTRVETLNGNPTWVPVCTPNARSTPAMIDFVKSIIGG